MDGAIGAPQEPVWPTRNVDPLSEGITLQTGTYGAALPLSDNRVFTGWIEPADKSWIIFLGADGKPLVYYADRDASGAVVGHRVDLEDKGKNR